MLKAQEQRDPNIWEALISLVSLVAGISISIVVYGADPHIPMLLGVFVAAVMAWRAGYEWEVVQDGMLKGIANSLQDIVIKKFIPKCIYKPFDTELEGATEVLKGNADAFVYDMPYNVVFMAMHGADKLIFLDKPFTTEPLAWPSEKMIPIFSICDLIIKS